MESYLSDIRYVSIPPYRMAKAEVISEKPEDEVISILTKWVGAKKIDPGKSRCFGFDVPVSDEDKALGKRGYEYWISVPESILPTDQVGIVDFEGGDYIAMRITDPFSAPCERIPMGWKTLVEYVKQNKIKPDWCSTGGCLEEVIVIKKITYMDVLIKLKK